jgi:two-component system, chemotaxis family, protein-glutamate methylesterase/glutaminase
LSGHDIIVIGASAGGVEALRTLVHALPAHFPASVFVVLHIPAHKPSAIPTLLSHAGPLRTLHPIFCSAAHVYGPRVVGVILTGTRDDGTAGLLAVKRSGGVAIVQDPDEARFPAMPRSALASVTVDYTVPLSGIAPLLVRLVAFDD